MEHVFFLSRFNPWSHREKRLRLWVEPSARSLEEVGVLSIRLWNQTKGFPTKVFGCQDHELGSRLWRYSNRKGSSLFWHLSALRGAPKGPNGKTTPFLINRQIVSCSPLRWVLGPGLCPRIATATTLQARGKWCRLQMGCGTKMGGYSVRFLFETNPKKDKCYELISE